MKIFKEISKLSDDELNEAIDKTDRALMNLIDKDEPERKDLLDRLNALGTERIKRKRQRYAAHTIEEELTVTNAPEESSNRTRIRHLYIVDTVDGKRRRLAFNHPLDQILNSFILADHRNPDGWIETADGDMIHSGRIIYFSKQREEER